MRLVRRGGKAYLVGTAAEVGRALTKAARKNAPVDLGWSLSKQADEASAIVGDTYECAGCSYRGIDATFVGGGCPECGGREARRA
jgi:hypothetical protein